MSEQTQQVGWEEVWDDIRKKQPLGEQCAGGKNYFVLLAPRKLYHINKYSTIRIIEAASFPFILST